MDPNDGQAKLVNLLHKVPRLAYTNNVAILLTTNRWDYVRGILFLPALIGGFFFFWAVLLLFSKYQYNVVSCGYCNSRKKKCIGPRCCSLSLVVFLMSFVSIVICASLYISKGAFQTATSFDIIAGQVREFESIANNSKAIVTSLYDLKEKTLLLTTEFIDLLNSTLHNNTLNDKVDELIGGLDLDDELIGGLDLDNFKPEIIDELAGVDIETLFDDDISEVDSIAIVIDALAANASKYDKIGGLDAFIADTGINPSKLDEMDGSDEFLATLGINADKLNEKEGFDREFDGREGFNKVIVAMDVDASKHYEGEHKFEYSEDEEYEWGGRVLAYVRVKARQLRDFDTFRDAGISRYLNPIEEMIQSTIEELSLFRTNLAEDLPNVMHVIKKATSAIHVVRKIIIKVGHYAELTAFGSIPVILLPLFLIVGLGVGLAVIEQSNINGMYSRFLSWFVLPLFVLVIICCLIGFAALGLLAVVTAGKI